MSKPFLGVGVGFPITLEQDPTQQGTIAKGTIAVAAYEKSVRQSIWIVLGTAKGERVMRPEFGCGIHDLVFEVITPSTAGQISHAVSQALLLFEPRIDVLEVQVVPEVNQDGSQLLISIDYQVRATNNIFNLVYPFYLERGAG
jgi:hypothetical protein